MITKFWGINLIPIWEITGAQWFFPDEGYGFFFFFFS